MEVNFKNAKILDPCCGSRMFWFDRQNPNVVFGDIRKEEHKLCDGRTLVIEPDVLMDFRKMPFNDEQFSLVVFDPPHL
ncbi:SAM-dependent methyltransferase, partial [Acinetobacter baumannii]|nr:SAM-dependent methyltransferase [Acinetobacter baumannii]ELS4602024.1 SAM-dependent methyltransferase [Acinetobacter baumannii]